MRNKSLGVVTRLAVLGSELRGGYLAYSILHLTSAVWTTWKIRFEFPFFTSIPKGLQNMSTLWPSFKCDYLRWPTWVAFFQDCPVSWTSMVKVKGNMSWQSPCVFENETNKACRWTVFVRGERERNQRWLQVMVVPFTKMGKIRKECRMDLGRKDLLFGLVKLKMPMNGLSGDTK